MCFSYVPKDLSCKLRTALSFNYSVTQVRGVLKVLINRIAKIGYEDQVKEAFGADKISGKSLPKIGLDKFSKSLDVYTIVDIRNANEVAQKRIFKNTIDIPLPELLGIQHQ